MDDETAISLLGTKAVMAAQRGGAQCSNNLKQIGLALLSYEDVYSTLPPGGYKRGNQLSWAAIIPGAPNSLCAMARHASLRTVATSGYCRPQPVAVAEKRTRFRKESTTRRYDCKE
jgi:hypothetical protein